MSDLNPILISIGISMYILPAFAVLCTISACIAIIYKHNKIEKEYVDKYRLISTYEQEEDIINKTINKETEVDIEIDITDIESETTSLLGDDNV